MTYTREDLRMADRHIAEAERHVLRQEELLSEMRMKGADTRLAEELLAEFHHSLRMYRGDRERIALALGG